MRKIPILASLDPPPLFSSKHNGIYVLCISINMLRGKVLSINISKEKGQKKKPVEEAHISKDGIDNDAHAGDWHRQISLLANESIDVMRMKLDTLRPGDFAENITTQGIDLSQVRIGQRLRMGQAVLEITQIGKECHRGCEIREAVGDCIMPREGIFAKVINAGSVKKGDPVVLMEDPDD